MGRKIILLSDGTGNSSAKVWRTNVWRVFESLDLSGSDQVAFYDDGVGTATFKPLAILGGAFGFGLARNVVDIYKFACRNYRNKDDAIYGFGFSRGAFTIRVVIGLILEQGLIQEPSETELHKKAKAAYRAYRHNNFHTNWRRCREWVRRLRDATIRRKSTDTDNKKNINTFDKLADVNIRFLGLWDTVAAYGMPVEEMARGISQWIYPWMLPDCLLDARVQRGCHALSIDDDRTTFHPVLWDEGRELPLVPNAAGKRLLANERISQVWFAGAHSNVGGGYPDDSLAQIPLVWILSEARTCGLGFKSHTDANPQTYGHPETAQDKDGRIYDPRKGLGGYYRYGPRDILTLGSELLSRGGNAPLARIHESVFDRIKNRAHAYAPLGLPAEYEIVTASGEVLSTQQRRYEANPQARWNSQQMVWNTVWWRRVVYFLSVIVSLILFAFPVTKLVPSQDEYTTPLRWVSQTVRLVGQFLPNAATPWMDGYARAPGKFIFVSLLLVIVLLWSSRLAGLIQENMDALWRASIASRLSNPGLPKNLVYRLRNNPRVVHFQETLQKKVAPALFALLFVYLGVTFASHVLFNVQDYAGLVCRKTPNNALQTLATGDFLVVKNGNMMTLNGLDTYAQQAKHDNNIADRDKNNPFKYLPQYLAASNMALPELSTTELCHSTGLSLDQYGTYNIKFDSTKDFTAWNGTVAPYGYYSDGAITAPPKTKPKPSKAPGTNNVDTSSKIVAAGAPTTPLDQWVVTRALWALRSLMMAALLPLRRELTLPWFRIVARIGSTGGQEESYEPDFTDMFVFNSDIKANLQGELYLFVNDAVFGIPPLYSFFYNRNGNSTKVLITRK